MRVAACFCGAKVREQPKTGCPRPRHAGQRRARPASCRDHIGDCRNRGRRPALADRLRCTDSHARKPGKIGAIPAGFLASADCPCGPAPGTLPGSPRPRAIDRTIAIGGSRRNARDISPIPRIRTAWRQGRRADRHPASDNRPAPERPLLPRDLVAGQPLHRTTRRQCQRATGRCFSSSSASPSACASRARAAPDCRPSPDRPAASGPVTGKRNPCPRSGAQHVAKLREQTNESNR